MKTFFLNKLRQGLFLLLAVLGTFVSYAQPTQKLKINSLPGICYMAEVTENEPTQLFYIAETGGKGTSSDTGQVFSPNDLVDAETGGSKGTNTNTGDYAAICVRSSVSETGGKNSSGGMEQSDTGGGNGGKSTTGEFTICDTGGRSTNSTGEFTFFDTGGRGNELGGGGIFSTVCTIYIPE
ncbi:hypothetical protein [Flavobacterium sp.]|uniref:hypothetical protein n=1 Tax=Flavobacterium sp. TaxID=239 RepID=UPI00286DDBDF|nr:hypothetical protein [Flavobacterium sp.]